jgi:hypothetical protein
MTHGDWLLCLRSLTLQAEIERLRAENNQLRIDLEIAEQKCLLLQVWRRSAFVPAGSAAR